MQEIYSDPVKCREWYLTCPPEVYDETMRILNFNDPYHLIDQLVESEEEGGLGLKRELKIIDVGCGTGVIGRHLSAAGFKNIFGTDGSENVLEKAKESGNYYDVR